MESYRRIWLLLSHFSVQIPHYFYWLATVQAAQRLAQRRSRSMVIHLKEADSLTAQSRRGLQNNASQETCVCVRICLKIILFEYLHLLRLRNDVWFLRAHSHQLKKG